MGLVVVAAVFELWLVLSFVTFGRWWIALLMAWVAVSLRVMICACMRIDRLERELIQTVQSEMGV